MIRELLGRARGRGYRHVGWHVDAEDWEPGRTATSIAAIVVDGALRHGDGAVVLLHTWPTRPRGALPRDRAGCGDAGATLVTARPTSTSPPYRDCATTSQ